MALAYDAFSNGNNVFDTSLDISFTHTPVGTPRGVIAFVVASTTFADGVAGVTYGGTPLTQVTGSPNLFDGTVDFAVHAFHLGSSIPTGAQTVVVDTTGSVRHTAYCITVTGAADTVVQDTDASIASDASSSPSAILSLGSQSCFVAEAFGSGASTPSDISPLTGWTKIGRAHV